MAVTKRPGREKPTKIGQGKIRGPQIEQIALLARPIYIGQAQGEEKHIKRGAKGPGVGLSPPRARSFLLSLSLSFMSFG